MTERPRDDVDNNVTQADADSDEQANHGDSAEPPADSSHSGTKRPADGETSQLPVSTRLFVERYGTAVLAVFVIIAVIGGVGLYTVNAAPATEERTETVAEWSTSEVETGTLNAYGLPA